MAGNDREQSRIFVCRFCAACAGLFWSRSAKCGLKLQERFLLKMAEKSGKALEGQGFYGYSTSHGEVAEWSKALPC
ncbi:hypothetical protein [Pseudohoeflea coraliihabitans]|uniref:Uncharacterized protein n=1 Tax=Pseudohoeflea coraliihabitans TaxID=2860393 RepID=A0ABS6WJN8_9HYPH|nr:hypothetical protein [Pseudohoeflea sp. DP4N28-3]MBW3095682.1 hypothetical protein [Pseudohoeflea sp. DP4N28-3]